MKILNIHGFSDSRYNNNYRIIKEFYKGRSEVEIVSPQIDYVKKPEDIITPVADIYDIVVGDGFGGIFAYIVGSLCDVRVLLTSPYIPIRAHLYKLDKEYPHLAFLEDYWETVSNRNTNCHILLGDADPTIQAVYGELKDTAQFTLISGADKLEGEDYENWLKTHLL